MPSEFLLELLTSFTPFLYVTTHEVLGILLEHRVDFVEDVVDVLGQLLVAFLDVGRLEVLDLLDVLGLASGALLAALVFCGHVYLRRPGALSRQYLPIPTSPCMSSAVRDTMATVDVDEIADRLYSLAPEDFTAARDEEARNASDPGLRKAVKALRKPTAA